MSKKKIIKPKMEVHDHWRDELTKLRCWMSGFHAGMSEYVHIPGEDVARQIIMAIDNAIQDKEEK
jgi:hypothetical protein